jgi:hypothetical protein
MSSAFGVTGASNYAVYGYILGVPIIYQEKKYCVLKVGAVGTQELSTRVNEHRKDVKNSPNKLLSDTHEFSLPPRIVSPLKLQQHQAKGLTGYLFAITLLQGDYRNDDNLQYLKESSMSLDQTNI